MWTEFESNENSVVEFLSRFWLPTFSPPRGFTDRPSTVIWTPSRDDLQSLVMNEESAEGLRRSTFTVISLRPRKGSSLFEITYVKAPFVADFFNEDAKIYRKVLAWSGSLDENRLGISVTRGYGCFCEEHVGIFRIASVLRDEVTYEPKSASLKLESSYDGNRVSNFEIFNLFEENARLNFIIFKDQKDFVDQGQKEVLSSFFYRKIYDILDPFQADGNI